MDNSTHYDEVLVPAGIELVSTTDTQGKITYANDAFCKVAGFTLDELVGQHHNIVRHQDMPKEAFADLWQHLKKGNVWRGAVKNRTKEGNYYWVDAFVSPIYEDGRLIGYQSVRVKIGDAEKTRAINLYRQFKQNKAPNMQLEAAWVLKLAVALIASILSIVGASLFHPLLSLVAPCVIALLYYRSIFSRPSQERQLAQAYDSVSRLVFCDDKNSSSEFHLKVEQGRVRTILGRTIDSSQALYQNVIQLNASSNESQHNIKAEAEELAAISIAIEEMATTITDVAQNSVITSEQVATANQQCNQAIASIEVTRSKVQTMESDIKKSSQIASDLVREADNVSHIMTEIQGVAEQTNLLALNAAIEAARAGEQGRGFAVVADEVRALSSRTHQATEQIQSSISNIQNVLGQLAVTMNANEAASQDCVEDTLSSEQKVTRMSEILAEISEIAIQTSTSAEEQSLVSKEIKSNILRVSQASNDNLIHAQSVSKLAKELEVSANNLGSLGLSFSNKSNLSSR
ncbi:methyl-accepting chemotaxis protein [Vibrio scophthalmi]|uniref:methyl-accepting chemotaxis protein n=1 Tax=Vibrio scophthalmi TaxID=45658 RepID=UPI003AAE53D3